MVQWLRILASTAGVVGSIPLVRELRSHMLGGQKKKKSGVLVKAIELVCPRDRGGKMARRSSAESLTLGIVPLKEPNLIGLVCGTVNA